MFEHHSHALKRTYPLREGQRAEEGVVYLGDGCWAVLPREVHPPEQLHSPESLWYLGKAFSAPGGWFVRLTPKEAVLELRSSTGKCKDRWIQKPRHLFFK